MRIGVFRAEMIRDRTRGCDDRFAVVNHHLELPGARINARAGARANNSSLMLILA